MDWEEFFATARTPRFASGMLTPRGPEMTSYTPSPSEAIAYKLGQLQDPGTPGDKRQIYDVAKNQANAISMLFPPVGAATSLLDLGHAYGKYKEGEGSATDVAAAAVPAALGGKLPKLRGAFHGTSSVVPYERLKLSDRDMGIHITTDPNVARGYAMGDYTPNFFYNNMRGRTIDMPGIRTMPVVADVRNPLRYPGDPVNWQTPKNVLETLSSNLGANTASQGMPYRKLLDELTRVEGKPGKFEHNFEDWLRGHNFDAVQYPHTSPIKSGFNSFMMLDPDKVIPRFTPEAQALIKERGMTLPSHPLRWNTMDQTYWDLKTQGIIGNKADNIAAAMQKGIKYDQDTIKPTSLLEDLGSESKVKQYWEKLKKEGGSDFNMSWDEFFKEAKKAE